ncbi:hypothetical protein TKK_0018431 [Trichogramma kaykai]
MYFFFVDLIQKSNSMANRDNSKEEESEYISVGNGPYAYLAKPVSSELTKSADHVLVNVFFVTPVLCDFCKDYIWGTGERGVKCKGKSKFLLNLN